MRSINLSDGEVTYLTTILVDKHDPIAVALVIKLKEPPLTTYTVNRGDTLWSIAEKVYGKGKGNLYRIIFEANKPMLSDPDKIQPGQVLNIPDQT